jgi:hypothetical protein
MLRGVAGKFQECSEIARNKREQIATRCDIKMVRSQKRFSNLSGEYQRLGLVAEDRYSRSAHASFSGSRPGPSFRLTAVAKS